MMVNKQVTNYPTTWNPQEHISFKQLLTLNDIIF